MSYLRSKISGAVTDNLDSQSLEYRTLTLMRVQAATTSAAVPSGITGEEGSTFTLRIGQTIWEEIAQEDAEVAFADPTLGRVFVLYCGSAALTVDETTNFTQLTNVAGSLTDVEYVPVGAIVGGASNYRTITLNQVVVTGTSSPARAVNALATLAFNSTSINGVALVPSALAIGTAAFTAVPPATLEVVSSHTSAGAVDPGGILYGVYTRT